MNTSNTEWAAYDSTGKLRACFDSETEARFYIKNRGHMYGGSVRPLRPEPDLLAVLEVVFANAAESPEWIRARIGPAIAAAKDNQTRVAKEAIAEAQENIAQNLMVDNTTVKILLAEINPPTYPARPVNGGPLEQALKFPRPGRWLYEPKVNGWRALVHVPTGRMFNRKLEPLSIAGEFTKAIERLRELDIADWLDCEAFERRHGIGKGALVVLDVPVPQLTYLQRRKMIEAAVGEHYGIPNWEETLTEGDIRYAWAWEHLCDNIDGPVDITNIWTRLQEINRRLGCEFYEGLVAKRADSLYPMQLRSPDEEFAGWTKHRWAF